MKKLILTFSFLLVITSTFSKTEVEKITPILNEIEETKPFTEVEILDYIVIEQDVTKDPCFIIGNIVFDILGENEEAVRIANKLCKKLNSIKKR